MTTVSRTFDVRPQPSVVLDYLKDFSNAEEWDPGTESCTRNDSGPVRVGSTWHNVSKIAGVSTELTYTLDQLTDDTVVLVGTNDTATSTDTITVVPSPDLPGGSRVTYEAVIELSGAAKIADPVMKIVFEKIGNDTEDDMTTVLNRLAG
jgi:carbon monoxide dehydrogenase subunit G